MIDISSVTDALEAQGWIVGAPVWNSDDGHLRVKLPVSSAAGRPPAAATLNGYGRKATEVLRVLAEDAKSWTTATDKARLVRTMLEEKYRRQSQAAALYEVVQDLEEEVERVRVQDFLEHVRDHLRDVRWEVGQVSNSCVRLKARDVADAVECKIAKTLGFGDHGAAEIVPGLTIRTNDGELCLTAKGFPVLLGFFHEHDLLDTIDLRKLDEMITAARTRVKHAEDDLAALLDVRRRLPVQVRPGSA